MNCIKKTNTTFSNNVCIAGCLETDCIKPLTGDGPVKVVGCTGCDVITVNFNFGDEGINSYYIYIADRPVKIIKIKEIHTVASTSVVSTANIVKVGNGNVASGITLNSALLTTQIVVVNSANAIMGINDVLRVDIIGGYLNLEGAVISIDFELL